MTKENGICTKILTEGEVTFMTERVKKALGKDVVKEMERYGMDMEGGVRFMVVSHKCREAREKRSLSIKDVSAELKIPQYRIKYIESGSIGNIEPDVLLQYIGLLGLDSWFSRWKRANKSLAEKLLSHTAPERKRRRKGTRK